MLRNLLDPIPGAADEKTTIVPRTVFESTAPSPSLVDETDLAILDFNHAQNLKPHDSAIVWYAVMHSETGDPAYLDAVQKIAAHVATRP